MLHRVYNKQQKCCTNPLVWWSEMTMMSLHNNSPSPLMPALLCDSIRGLMCILNTAMIMTHILISATNHLPSRWSTISAYQSFSICIWAEYSRSLAHSLVSCNFLCWKKLIWNGIVAILQWLYDCPVKFGGCFSHSYLWTAVLCRLTLAAALSVTHSDSQTEAGLWCLC